MISLSDIRKLRSKVAMDSCVRDKYAGDPARIVEDINAALNHYLRTDLRQAERFVAEAERCSALLADEFRPLFLAMQARSAHWMGDYRSALLYYRRALDIHRQRKESEAVARIGRGIMDVQMYLGNYPEALRIGRQSLRYFKRKGRDIDAAQVMTNLGNIYHRMDQNRRALQYYDKAREIFQKKGGTALAIVEYNRANIYANMNQLKKARALYEASAGLYQRSGMEIAEAQARYSLAYLYFLEDKFTRAIQIFEDVYDRFVVLGDAKSAAMTKLDLIEVNIQLNQHGSAIMLGSDVIKEFKELGMSYERAKAHYFIAWARMQLGDVRQAAQELKQALALFSREHNKLWMGMVGIARSKLHTADRKFSRALAASRKAMTYFSSSGDERRMTDADIAYADTLAASGKLKEALRCARRVLGRNPTSSQTYHLYNLMGGCYYRQGDYKTALQLFKSATAAAEQMVSGLYPDDIRFFFLLDKYEAYRMLVECLLKLGRVRQAFVSNLAALAVVNQRHLRQADLRKQVPQRLLDERDSLRVVLKKMNQMAGSQPQPVRASVSYCSVEEKLWAVERRIRSTRYPSRSLKRQVRVNLDNIRRFVRNSETVINFIESDGAVGAFCSYGNSTEYRSLNITADELNATLRKLHFLLERTVLSAWPAADSRRAVDHHLSALHHALIEPLADRLRSDCLIIVADGRFAQIPFQALRSRQGQDLRSKYSLRLVVNPDDPGLGRSSSKGFAVSRNAIFAVTSDLLPSVDVESNGIQLVFQGSHVYTHQEATVQNLNRELQEADGFIHIAAHASRSSENPLFSRILMADGPFFPFDLFGHGLKAKLVTLSGCQTAGPGLYYGNSFSLAKAFHQAGSQYVLASLWPVSDRLSMMFMTEFYRSLRSSEDLFAAFDRAVGHVQSITDHPAFWAPFVLLGL